MLEVKGQGHTLIQLYGGKGVHVDAVASNSPLLVSSYTANPHSYSIYVS